MPLPTAAELTDPNATNTQMKQRLGRLAESAIAREDVPQNLIFDSFNETVLTSKDDSAQCYQNAEFSTLLENSGVFGKNVLNQVSNAHLRRYFDVKKMGLKVGDKIYVRILCNFAAPDSASRATLYFRNSSLDTIAFQGKTPVSGTNDLIFELTMTSQANYLMIELSGAGEKSLIASSASFLPNPKFIYGASPAKVARTASEAKQKSLDNEVKAGANTLSVATNAKNVLPDPFFRLYSAGIRVDDLQPLSESTNVWSLVDYPASPFDGKKALFVSAGGTANSYKRFNRVCAKVGDTLSVKCGIVAKSSGSFQLGAYVRNSVGTVIGTTAATTFALIADQYAEIVHTITITQAMIDDSFNLNIRFNVSNSSFPSGYYILGCVGHLNNTTQKINDTDQNNDELRLMIRELQNQITVDVPHTYGQYYLRETHERLMRRKLSENARLSVLTIGDSWTQTAARWVLPFTNHLVANYGDGGGGWVGFGAVSNGSTNANRNARTSYTMDKTGTWTETYSSSSSVSPDLCHSTSTIAGSKIQCNAPNAPAVSAVDLYYVATADGVIKYRFNGGTWSEVTLNSTSTDTLGIAALTGFANAYHQLEIEVVSGTVRLCGLNWKSEANGIVVHKLGASGSQAAQWAAANALEFQKGINSLNPNLVFVMLGTNDQGANRTAAQFKNDIATIIDRIRAASATTDIFVVIPCENNRSNSVSIASYTAEVYKLCKTKKVAFLDLQKDFGDDPSEYSSTSSRPWLAADLIHPNSMHKAIVAAILRFMS